ncbi:hypothetical protein IT412_02495 [Candidatus Peregrinibacteria bacterium]|nr:hypothetical protein [Candidatus Peregrinibacteria bacterium]
MNNFYYVLVVVLASGLLFAGCADNNSSIVKQTTNVVENGGNTVVTDENGVKVYLAEGKYRSPAGQETIQVSLDLKNDKISDIKISSNTKAEISKKFQGLFLEGVKKEIIGKSITEVGTFDKVNGSSLTGAGFNQAMATLKSEIGAKS